MNPKMDEESLVKFLREGTPPEESSKLREQVRKGAHPSKEIRYAYSYCLLPKDEARLVRKHLLYCEDCNNEVLRLMKKERDRRLATETAEETSSTDHHSEPFATASNMIPEPMAKPLLGLEAVLGAPFSFALPDDYFMAHAAGFMRDASPAMKDKGFPSAAEEQAATIDLESNMITVEIPLPPDGGRVGFLKEALPDEKAEQAFRLLEKSLSWYIGLSVTREGANDVITPWFSAPQKLPATRGLRQKLPPGVSSVLIGVSPNKDALQSVIDQITETSTVSAPPEETALLWVHFVGQRGQD